MSKIPAELRSDRRDFFRQAAATGLAGGLALSAGPAWAANDRITCAIVGIKGRGRSFFSLAGRRDAVVKTLCDVDANALSAASAAVEKAQGKPPHTVEDFRRVLDDEPIDAVVHRHAAPLALPDRPAPPCRPGKHVYVEKPASHVYREGQLLVAGRREVQARRSSTARRCAPARSPPRPASC